VAKSKAAPVVTPATPASAAKAAVVPPTPSQPTDAKRPTSAVQLVSLHPDDTPEEQFPLLKEQVAIGRRASDIACGDDVYMADTHALLVRRGADYALEDKSAGSGVWLRAKGVAGRPVGENDLVWIGAQILMVTKPGAGWAVTHYNAEGVQQATHAIPEKGLIIGRNEAVSLDRSDLSLSRRHAQFRSEGGRLGIFDLGSKNGTYVKLMAPTPLANGDEFRVASKRFRFEQFSPISKLAASDVVMAAPTPAPASDPAAAPAAAAAGGFTVSLNHGEYAVNYTVAPDQDLLHAYFHDLKARFPDGKVSKEGDPRDHHEEPLDWECKIGQCGLCAIEIVEGTDNFVPADPGSMERPTMEKVRQLDWNPKKYRLACVAKIKGPVKLTIPPA
jgi:pSer/pThr/pTyr-binding forkhead associated (FHA) protein/ferredoxin